MVKYSDIGNLDMVIFKLNGIWDNNNNNNNITQCDPISGVLGGRGVRKYYPYLVWGRGVVSNRPSPLKKSVFKTGLKNTGVKYYYENTEEKEVLTAKIVKITKVKENSNDKIKK